MPTLTRRRFLSLSAIAALPLSFPARAAQITQWHGTALRCIMALMVPGFGPSGILDMT